MNHPKLLIVDDDTDVCRQMQWTLTSDYQVFLAHDRTSARHMCQAQQPVTMILDLGLPWLQGYRLSFASFLPYSWAAFFPPGSSELFTFEEQE